MAKVGILALQGAFIEHKKILESLGAECVEIRQKKDLKDLAGIVLPAGKYRPGTTSPQTGSFYTGSGKNPLRPAFLASAPD